MFWWKKKKKKFHKDSVEGKYLEAIGFAKNYHEHILDRFEPYFGKKILEIGAGIGSVSKLLLERKLHKITSVEPSEFMYNKLKKINHKKHNCFKGFLSDYLKEGKSLYDSILYINVLEHVKDDLDEMKKAYKALNKGGHILTFSPALPMLYSKFDHRVGHHRRYWLNEKKDKLQKAGFEIIEANYFDFIGSFLWLVKNTLLGSKTIDEKSVELFDKHIMKLVKREPKWIPWGKNVLVVGRKI